MAIKIVHKSAWTETELSLSADVVSLTWKKFYVTLRKYSFYFWSIMSSFAIVHIVLVHLNTLATQKILFSSMSHLFLFVFF